MRSRRAHTVRPPWPLQAQHAVASVSLSGRAIAMQHLCAGPANLVVPEGLLDGDGDVAGEPAPARPGRAAARREFGSSARGNGLPKEFWVVVTDTRKPKAQRTVEVRGCMRLSQVAYLADLLGGLCPPAALGSVQDDAAQHGIDDPRKVLCWQADAIRTFDCPLRLPPDAVARWRSAVALPASIAEVAQLHREHNVKVGDRLAWVMSPASFDRIAAGGADWVQRGMRKHPLGAPGG